MRAGLNAKTTHSAFLSQNFVTSDEKRILRIPGSASFRASYPTEPVPPQVILGLATLRLIHRQAVRFPLANSDIRQRLLTAYRRGQNSSFDVDVWQPETQWAMPLLQVQAMVGL